MKDFPNLFDRAGLPAEPQKNEYMMVTCEDVGEFGLIARLQSLVPSPDHSVVVGIGDDAAALQWEPGQLLLSTVDAQIEGVHFRWELTSPEKVGRKLAAINVSDLAAMGGTPRYALAHLALPPKLPVEIVEKFYSGLVQGLEEVGAMIVGGNISAASHFAADLTLLGQVRPQHLKTRAGAKKGDILCVTGTLGKAAAGFALAQQERALTSQEKRLVSLWQTPRPALVAGKFLASCSEVHAMMDISDGLAGDLVHLARASSVGALVEETSLPVDRSVVEAAQKLQHSALDWALFGGEDYELLFTVAEEKFSWLEKQMQSVAPITPIGKIVEAQKGIQLVRANGESVPISQGGWTHF